MFQIPWLDQLNLKHFYVRQLRITKKQSSGKVWRGDKPLKTLHFLETSFNLSIVS